MEGREIETKVEEEDDDDGRAVAALAFDLMIPSTLAYTSRSESLEKTQPPRRPISTSASPGAWTTLPGKSWFPESANWKRKQTLE